MWGSERRWLRWEGNLRNTSDDCCTFVHLEIAEKEPVEMKLSCSGSAGFLKKRPFQFSISLSGHAGLVFHCSLALLGPFFSG
jgi:hypothetical protein